MIASKRCHYNLFSKEQWAEMLRKNGFEVVMFKYFEGEYGWTKYFLHHFLATGRCFEFKLFEKIKMIKFMERLLHFYYTSLGYPYYCMVRDNKMKWGTDFFIKAVKNKKKRRD